MKLIMPMVVTSFGKGGWENVAGSDANHAQWGTEEPRDIRAEGGGWVAANLVRLPVGACNKEVWCYNAGHARTDCRGAKMIHF